MRQYEHGLAVDDHLRFETSSRIDDQRMDVTDPHVTSVSGLSDSEVSLSMQSDEQTVHSDRDIDGAPRLSDIDGIGR